LFALVGLTLLVIGLVRFLDMGLKTWVFPQAYEEDRLYNEKPRMVPQYLTDKTEDIKNEKDLVTLELTKEQSENLKNLLVANTEWEEKRKKIDPVTAKKHEQASMNLALILVGLPLYLTHWLIIRRETKEV